MHIAHCCHLHIRLGLERGQVEAPDQTEADQAHVDAIVGAENATGGKGGQSDRAGSNEISAIDAISTVPFVHSFEGLIYDYRSSESGTRNRTSLWITQAPLKKAIDLLIRLCCGRMAVASDHVENLVIAEAMSAFPQKDAEPLSSTEEPQSNF